jgi:hypothetical protein
MAPHTATHVITGSRIKHVPVDAGPPTELALIFAICAVSGQTSTEKLQWAVGFNDYIGEMVSARIMGGEEVVLSWFVAVKSRIIFVDGLVLHVDKFVVLPHGIPDAISRAVALNQSMSSFIRVSDNRGYIVIPPVDANVAVGRQSWIIFA